MVSMKILKILKEEKLFSLQKKKNHTYIIKESKRRIGSSHTLMSN